MSIKKFIIAGLCAIIFVAVLRGIIEFFHPKEGSLVYAIQSLLGESAMHWVLINISYPSYDFLIKNVWSNSLVFWVLVSAIFGLGYFTISLRKSAGKYT